MLYKGAYGWLKDNLKLLEDSLMENAALCVEWIGMGKLKYPNEIFNKKCYMFAKGNVDDDFSLYNLKYDHELFKYSFVEQDFLDIIGVVPVVEVLNNIPSISELNLLYSDYSEHEGRNIEGFVVNFNNDICKYVRMKNGKLEEHFERGE